MVVTDRNQDPLGRILQSYAGLASKSERYPGMLQCGYTPEAAPASSSLFCFLQIPCHPQLECIPCVKNLGPHLLRVRWVQRFRMGPLISDSLWKSNPEESHPYIQIQRSSSKILSDMTWTFGFSISKHSNPLQISMDFSFQCPPSRHFQAVEVSLHGKVSISRPCPENCRAIRNTLDAGLPSLGF